MSKQKKDTEAVTPEEETPVQTAESQEPETAAPETAEQEQKPEEKGELLKLQAELAEKEDRYLRLAAEYDNFRKRTQREKENLWTDAKADTAGAFLSVYDNLERALKQETADAAYKKGVELTMTQLRTVLNDLGVEEIPALGEKFDPNVHNAVMHVEDDQLEENTIAEVFQQGFRIGEKVIRFAMVKVAN